MIRRANKSRHRRFSATMALAGVALLALAAGALATVFVYSNGFNRVGDFREIEQVSGGRDCDRSYARKAKAMRIKAKADVYCGFAPPVAGDAAQPNHEIIADGKILKGTSRLARRGAYLGVRVRTSPNSYYEFRVMPRGKAWRLSRLPATSGGGLPMTGRSDKIRGIGGTNVLRLRVTNGQVVAIVNRDRVATFTDPNPQQVDGRRVAFGVGSTRDDKNGPIAAIKRVQVGVPDP